MKFALDLFLSLWAALLFPRLICDETTFLSGGLLGLLVFGALLALFRSSPLRRSWRLLLFSHFAGLLFSVMTAFGFSIQNLGSVAYDDQKLHMAILVYTHVYARLLSLIWGGVEKLEARLSAAPKHKWAAAVERGLDHVLRRPYVVFPLLFLAWLPCWLATWPGNFVYDATKEWNQLENGWLGDFPKLHSLLITTALSWSFEKFGEYNPGIALFTGVQMALLAAMFTHVIWTLRREGTNRFVLTGVFLYCALFPGVHVLVTSTVRDVLFAGLLSYSIFWLWILCRNKKIMLASWWKPIGPALVLVLTVFARNNNTGTILPLLLAAVCAVLFLVGGKRGWKGALVFSVASLGSFFLMQGWLDRAVSPVTPPSYNASMSVYAQTLARTFVLEKENWDNQDYLEYIVLVDSGKQRYIPRNGDPTKRRLQLDNPEDRQRFMALWKKIGKQYPEHYADAFLANTHPAWFPGSAMDGYKQAGVAMYADYDKCWFFYADLIEEPGVLESKLPKLHDWYRDISLMTSVEKLPVISMLFSVGFHLWLAIACLFQAFYRKARQLYLPLVAVLAYAFISMCVPLMLLRYFAALLFLFPLILVFTLQPRLQRPKNAQELPDGVDASCRSCNDIHSNSHELSDRNGQQPGS